MRQKNETATSFSQIKEITQIMQALKKALKPSKAMKRTQGGNNEA